MKKLLLLISFAITLILSPLALTGKALLLVLVMMWFMARLAEQPQPDAGMKVSHDPAVLPCQEAS